MPGLEALKSSKSPFQKEDIYEALHRGLGPVAQNRQGPVDHAGRAAVVVGLLMPGLYRWVP